jgi:carbonic anhydrase/acetyltransferase-like protein (isoleucine patch superfamily)
MPLYELNNIKPIIGQGTWVAPSAEIIGNVRIGRNCFIGFGAVIRGDFGHIIIGDETAIEENVVIHCGKETNIGNRVIVGHLAMIHDATIEDKSLIGMKAMICDGAIIGEGAIIAEQTLVLRNQRIEPYKVCAGTPAVLKGDTSSQHLEMIEFGVQAYIDLARLYHQTCKKIKF